MLDRRVWSYNFYDIKSKCDFFPLQYPFPIIIKFLRLNYFVHLHSPFKLKQPRRLLFETYNNFLEILTGGNKISNSLHQLKDIPTQNFIPKFMRAWQEYKLEFLRIVVYTHSTVMICVNLTLWKIFPATNLDRARSLKHISRSFPQKDGGLWLESIFSDVFVDRL